MMGSNERNNWSDIVNAKLLIKEIVKIDVKFGRKRGISVICDLNDNAPRVVRRKRTEVVKNKLNKNVLTATLSKHYQLQIRYL